MNSATTGDDSCRSVAVAAGAAGKTTLRRVHCPCHWATPIDGGFAKISLGHGSCCSSIAFAVVVGVAAPSTIAEHLN